MAAATPSGITLNYAADVDYEVEGIIGHDELAPGKRVYLIKWKNYDDSWNSWEPEQMLDNCPELLAAYKSKAGIPLDQEAAVDADADVDTETEAEEEDEEEEPLPKHRVKLTPVKQRPRKSSGTGAGSRSGKPSSTVSLPPRSTARRGRKRKLSFDRDLVIAKRKPSTASHARPAATASVHPLLGSQGEGTGSQGDNESAQILELLSDAGGELLASIQRPGAALPSLMWYKEAKELYPDLVIKFFEAHLTFRDKVIQRYVLLPHPREPATPPLTPPLLPSSASATDKELVQWYK